MIQKIIEKSLQQGKLIKKRNQQSVQGSFFSKESLFILRAKVVSNPRDTIKKQVGKQGMGVKDCIVIFHEAGWKVHTGPSRFFSNQREIRFRSLINVFFPSRK